MGSSPRGRGKPPSTTSQRAAYRLIPAWAGKTVLVVAAHAPSRAHPRAGGENPCGRLARVGNGAHPRVGGENELMAFATSSFVGSSPRGRGKPAKIFPAHHLLRLIPARAGKTRGELRLLRGPAAHPRAGGENRLTWTGRTLAPGSSPRGRGKHCEPVECGVIAGLIPARAGKTCHSGFPLCSYSAHPRAGGENYAPPCGRLLMSGSSPRGRGKRAHDRHPRRAGRLIPARAGKTECFG